MPVRGETFVTRKITRGLARIEPGFEDTLYLGNFEANRDWGHARDMSSMHACCSGEPRLRIGDRRHTSVREFVELSFAEIGRSIEWRGKGIEETGLDGKTGKTSGAHRSGLFPSDRSRYPDRRCQQGPAKTRLEAENEFHHACQGNGGQRSRDRKARGRGSQWLGLTSRARRSSSPGIAAWSAPRWCAG